MPSLTQDVSTYKDLVDELEENRPQKPKITMPIELAPLVTECLKSPNTPGSGDGRVETVLDIWDFAGQHLYYSTHPVFLSPGAIYLLVHDLQKNPNDLAEPSFTCRKSMPLRNYSNETNLDNLLSWLVSVHSMRRPETDPNLLETCKSNLHRLPPPVPVVGTHADMVSAQQMYEVESQIASSLKGKTYQEHVVEPFYRVDNTQPSNSPDVRKIQSRVQQLMCSGFTSTADLPVKWLIFEKAVKRLAREKLFMTLQEICLVAKQECLIEDNKQLDAMLNYYHDLGLIVRFSDTVVLDIQWLIDLFKKLITTRRFEVQVSIKVVSRLNVCVDTNIIVSARCEQMRVAGEGGRQCENELFLFKEGTVMNMGKVALLDPSSPNDAFRLSRQMMHHINITFMCLSAH